MRLLSTAFSVGAAFGTILGACGGDDFNDCRDDSSCPPGDASAGRGGIGATGGSEGASGASGTGGSVGRGGTSGATGTGGTNGSGADTGCDLNKSLAEDPCAIDEAYGVFVSAGGADAGDGTRSAPYRTIEEGMTAAKRAGKRVYVCADGGKYPAALNVGTALDGLELYGGFRCSDWQYSAALKAPITTTTPTAVRVTGLQTGLKLEDFAITAADATVDGGSSFGMIVANSSNVVLRRVHVTAGAGKAGMNGTNGSPGASGAMPDMAQLGKPASCGGDAGASHTGGGWSAESACGSWGGTGGAAYVVGNGDPGRAGLPNTNVNEPMPNNGGTGATAVGANGGAGQPGANGNPGTNGTTASAVGTFTASGFTPANGSDGTNGFPGQGGGGGGASKGNGTCIGASGGAGGMGGCGGTKGLGGGGGGASVALLSWTSQITLDATQLTAKNGGAGGKGGNAGLGGVRGRGADGGESGGTALGVAGRGGDGGQGGPGGSGSGGTGGPSHALVFHGTAPIKDSMPTLMVATGGAKGSGGVLAGGTPAPDGFAGASTPEYSQP